MTLKGKNRYTFILSIFFLAMSLVFLAYLILKINSALRDGTLFNYTLSITEQKQNVLIMIVSGIFMLVYIPLAAFYTYSHFIKTPSTEVIYFMLFLLGCSIELFRILIPLETSPNSFPEFIVLLGRMLFWGRILCFASMFTSATLGTPDQRVNAEQNIFIIIIFSLTLANIVPVNTSEVTSAFSIDVGLKMYMRMFCAVAGILTFLTYAIKAWQSESKKHLAIGVAILMMEIGYILLNSSGILVAVILGGIMLLAGTYFYLDRLHKLYL